MELKENCVWKISKDDLSLQRILESAEEIAEKTKLNSKQSMHLRLLAEELVEMLPSLLAFSSGEFWIEQNGKSFELHTVLTPNEAITTEQRDELLSVSSSGKNAAASGIMSKIRLAATFMIIDYERNSADFPLINDFYLDGMGTNPNFMVPAWSLENYRIKAKSEKNEKWDELEKSIIANIADDVVVGVEGRKVEIIVKKSF
ncbi:MAG: hypothetical protein IJ828_07250 [Treponema sp.]|nr:hypothetical protein [Treponema sp.]